MAALTDEDRAYLRALLADFTRGDAEPFVARALVEPTVTWFPEAFAPTSEGLAAIASRLLAYAGLEGHDADVTVDEGAVDADAMLPETRTDLAGIEGRTVFFSCTRLGRADDATYSLAHEVARAALLQRRLGAGASPYRAMESTELVEPDETEAARAAASVFATYLGLGLLSAAGSHHYRQTGRTRGRNQITAWQHVSYGGLSPEAASFVLALQLVARGIEGERLERLLASLPDERRSEVRVEMGRLDRDEVIASLGLPPVGAWPPEQSAPVPPPRKPARKKRKRAKRPANTHPVFRVRGDRRVLGGGLGTLGALVAGACVHGFVFPEADASFSLFLCALVGAAAGAGLGMQSGSDDCSDCERTIPGAATHCPSCKGVVAGRIKSREERLGAREAWESTQHASAEDRAPQD